MRQLQFLLLTWRDCLALTVSACSLLMLLVNLYWVFNSTQLFDVFVLFDLNSQITSSRSAGDLKKAKSRSFAKVFLLAHWPILWHSIIICYSPSVITWFTIDTGYYHCSGITFSHHTDIKFVNKFFIVVIWCVSLRCHTGFCFVFLKLSSSRYISIVGQYFGWFSFSHNVSA